MMLYNSSRRCYEQKVSLENLLLMPNKNTAEKLENLGVKNKIHEDAKVI